MISSIERAHEISQYTYIIKTFLLQFGVIFGGAQKNIGPAGVTVVIIREDLLGSPMKICPSVFDFTYISQMNSIHNTPATFW